MTWISFPFTLLKVKNFIALPNTVPKILMGDFSLNILKVLRKVEYTF